MFDFNSCIHMLELVLFSDRDGAQDPGSLSVVGQVVILWMIITLLIDGWLHPYLSLHGWLRPYLVIIMVSLAGWLRPFHRPFRMSLWMVVPMPRLHVLDYQRYFGPSWWCSSSACVVKHFTRPTLSVFML